jgi:predicted permease
MRRPARYARAAGVRDRGGMSSGLVVAEVALAVLLVAGAGLMLRSLQKLHTVHPGFDAAGVLTLRANPPAWRYGGLESQRAFHATALERVRALPGIASAGGIQLLPVSGGNWSFPTYPEGIAVPDGTAPPSVNFRVITPSYVETMAIPLIKGRTFSATDRADGARVALVNRAFVERFWPGLEPLGRTIRTFDPASTPYTVVGVIGDVHQFALDRAPRPELYVPHEQLVFEASLSYVVRVSDGDPAAHAAAVRDAIWGLDRDVPVSAVETMTSAIGRSAETTRFLTVLLGVFGGLALVLGAVGVYGVTAYTVARRLPEFGVRLALGASAGDVMQISLLRGFRPVFAGVLLGTAGALIGTRWIQSLLFGVSPHDPLAIAGGGLVLGAVGFIATLLPAWRATRIDPAAVLRAEG